ncbi:MAG: glycosyltransferase [Flavisolibacter sp.]
MLSHYYLLVLTLLFSVTYAILIQFYLSSWQAITEIIDFPLTISPVFISIVISARNEAENISILLNAIKNQNYPIDRFEIIVVDDFSSDQTAQEVKRMGLVNLTLLQPDNKDSSKKRAIETGVKKAKGELIVTTDADCIVPTEWLKTIAFYYQDKDAAFLAGPVKYNYKSNLLGIFQAIDFITLQGITGAAVHSKLHMMCNGANLAFKKSAFEKVNGYAHIDNRASGDDMLLMHKIYNQGPEKVFFMKTQKAVVTTMPMPDLRNFISQRKRWASKTFFYQDKSIIAILVFVYCYNVFFLFLFMGSALQFISWRYFVLSIGFKIVVEARFFRTVCKFYKQSHLLYYFIFIQPLHIIYTVFIGIISQFGKYEWKGRKTY